MKGDGSVIDSHTGYRLRDSIAGVTDALDGAGYLVGEILAPTLTSGLTGYVAHHVDDWTSPDFPSFTGALHALFQYDQTR